jgi:YfiH family protein
MSRSLFTSREGGVSSAPYESFNLATHVGDDLAKVLENREILAQHFGMDLENFFFMNQVHGRDVAVIDEHSRSSELPNVDALFTTRKELSLVVLVADCIPLLLHSERAVAAVHVGRQGLVKGVFEATLDLFKSHGITSSEMRAELGPSICGQCYEVDGAMFDDVTNQIPATASNDSCLNIEAGLVSLLEENGIAWSSLGECTAHNNAYFSYRRDGVTGRQAGVITL